MGSLFTHWVMVAPDEAAVAAKVRRSFPNGRDRFWGAYLVAGTPEQVAAYFQGFADAGIRNVVARAVDAEEEKTFTLFAHQVAPRVVRR